MVHALVKEHDLQYTEIMLNEFEEPSFLIRDTAGVSWQVIAQQDGMQNYPRTTLDFITKK